MYETISTAEMSHNEWLELRKTGIGGSDAGALCGLNPYSSAMTVFESKTSKNLSETDNEATRQGHDLEDYVAKRFSEASGLKVRRSNVMYRSKEYPFMIADVDRLIVGMNAGLECKTASAYSADKWKDRMIPPHYLIQCYHYMAVTGKPEWYIAVVILGQEFKYAKISWDDEIIGNLVAVESHFWNNYVLCGRLPLPDGSKACDGVLSRYFSEAQKASSIPLVGFDERLKRREDIINRMSELEKEQKQIEQEIKVYMGEHEQAYSDRYRVNWTNVETVRLDAQRIRVERPEIYKDFANITHSRRFTVKAA